MYKGHRGSARIPEQRLARELQLSKDPFKPQEMSMRSIASYLILYCAMLFAGAAVAAEGNAGPWSVDVTPNAGNTVKGSTVEPNDKMPSAKNSTEVMLRSKLSIFAIRVIAVGASNT